MTFQNHLKKSLEINNEPWPWPRMFLSMFAITIPLIIGHFLGEFNISMFGSLFSLVLILNDHFGPLKKRFVHLITTYLFLGFSFILGNYLIDHFFLFNIFLFVSSYMLGKFKNKGPELEKMILFSILYMMTIADSPSIKNMINRPLFYSSISFVIYLITMSLISIYQSSEVASIQSKKKTFKTAMLQNDSNFFSFFYAGITVFSFVLAKHFKLDRSYWITGTVLIVMLPDTHQSFQKAFQRVFGTVLGVILAAFLFQYFNSTLALLFFVALFAFLSPMGLLKNYWLGNFFIAALIIFFLKTAQVRPDAWTISYLRAIDISLGSIIGAIGIYTFSLFNRTSK